MNAPRSKNEQIKELSRFLRGGIADGLSKVETGAIAEDDAQLTKFHGTYLQDDRDLRPERRKKKLEQAYSFMIRVRVPGGVCTPAQWLAMDRIAGDYANGTLRLTTRQAFQLHGVIKSNLKRSMQAINTALLDTVAACGDVNRNVMCNPNPYQSRAHAAALELARAISDHLTPRTGAYHEIWLDGEQAVAVAEQVVTVQRDFGDRANRKHARLKYTIEDRGLDWFRTEVERRLGFALAPARPFRFEDTGDRYGWTKDHRGNWHYTLFIENGRVRDTPDRPMKTGLAEIARIHVGDFRLTANQNLIIASIRPRHKSTIAKLLQQ